MRLLTRVYGMPGCSATKCSELYSGTPLSGHPLTAGHLMHDLTESVHCPSICNP